jgi:hypothetical protein
MGITFHYRPGLPAAQALQLISQSIFNYVVMIRGIKKAAACCSRFF